MHRDAQKKQRNVFGVGLSEFISSELRRFLLSADIRSSVRFLREGGGRLFSQLSFLNDFQLQLCSCFSLSFSSPGLGKLLFKMITAEFLKKLFLTR